ncbi:unnamed protein product [Nippostrongylus brasiliensis]|uniref:dUTP diphosphatase n=1 Tax=Nippostrongylus brasiliensis TaxID=27835 RepID=A0A0N4YVC8_NIPBR|nr:unnamed protein product [Nippostrongylus brasiliensis]
MDVLTNVSENVCGDSVPRKIRKVEEEEVKKGDRIAQFICERIAHCNYVECESLTDTVRGDGGFGSTGK